MKKFKIENPNNYNLDVICLKTTSSETAVSHNHNHSHSGVYEGEKKRWQNAWFWYIYLH